MWAVYLTFALAVFVYAANVPVRFAFTLSGGDARTLKLGIGAFNARYIIQPEWALPHWRPETRPSWRGPEVRAALRAGRYLLRRARTEGMRLTARIGAGDAARTALLCGAAMTLCDALCAPVRIAPDFSARRLALSGSGIIHLRLGHIIHAAALFALEWTNGKVRQKWTSIQSKASCPTRWRTSGTWWT